MAQGDSSLTDREFLISLAHGQSVLVLGQRHTTGFISGLVQDLSAAADVPLEESLVAQLERIQPESIDGLRRAFELHPAAPSLKSVAGNPWSIVLTSAID